MDLDAGERPPMASAGLAHRPPHRERLRRQSGVFVVLFPFLVIALFGLIGLTLTSGNTFADRSKLQNMLDAVAIAAATQVNMMNARKLPGRDDKCSAPHVSLPGDGVLGVKQAVLNAFVYATAAGPNRSLRAAINGDRDLIIEYATTLNPADFSPACPDTDPVQPIYVRIRLNRRVDTKDFLTGIIEPWLGGESYDMRISGSAVAGPAPAAPMWDGQRCPLPIFLCDNSSAPDAACGGIGNGSACVFGYRKYWEAAFQGEGTLACGLVPPSRFLTISGPSAPSILDGPLAGVTGACPTLPDASGRVSTFDYAGPLSESSAAFNTRFFNAANWPAATGVDAGGSYPAALGAPGSDTVTTAWNADPAVKAGSGIGTRELGCQIPDVPMPDRHLAEAYVRAMASAAQATGNQQPLRRIVTVPVRDCQNTGPESAAAINGYVTVLLTRPMINDPGADTRGKIVGEIIDAGMLQGLGSASTVVGRRDSTSRGQGLLPPIWRIVLYRDAGARDS